MVVDYGCDSRTTCFYMFYFYSSCFWMSGWTRRHPLQEVELTTRVNHQIYVFVTIGTEQVDHARYDLLERSVLGDYGPNTATVAE
mgnify:CR=1 FL=1